MVEKLDATLDAATAQLRFIEWLATPKPLREPQTMTDLAKELGFSRQSLWHWQKDEGFSDKVIQLARQYMRTDLPDVLSALAEKAKGGDVPAIKLYLEFYGEYTPNQNITGAIKIEYVSPVGDDDEIGLGEDEL